MFLLRLILNATVLLPGGIFFTGGVLAAAEPGEPPVSAVEASDVPARMEAACRGKIHCGAPLAGAGVMNKAGRGKDFLQGR